MGIMVHQESKVIIQGITGREGSLRTKYMKEYGTNVIGGTSPGKAGEIVFGVPVFNTVREIVRQFGAIDGGLRCWCQEHRTVCGRHTDPRYYVYD